MHYNIIVCELINLQAAASAADPKTFDASMYGGAMMKEVGGRSALLICVVPKKHTKLLCNCK